MYNSRIIRFDTESGLEIQNWFYGSSEVYIANMINNLNYGNLQNKDGACSKDFLAFASNDTLTLEGQDSKGLFLRKLTH